MQHSNIDVIKSLSVPQASPIGTDTTIVYSRFPFDGGNRSNLYFSPSGGVVSIASCIAKLNDWEDAEGDFESVLIEYNSQKFLVGKEAIERNGQAPFKSVDSKAIAAKQLLMVALEPDGDRTDILIDTLVVQTPDIRLKAEVSQLERLKGHYSFKRNGVQIEAQVNKVEIVEECQSAWDYASAQGLFTWPDAKNGILDMGGGTTLARLYTTSGKVIRDAEVKLPGTFDLAKRIAAALQSKNEYTPDTSKIMDAIADGSYQLGSQTSFAGIFEQCRQQWIDEIRGQLKQGWATHSADIGEVLVVGGSAPLAQRFVDTTNGRFKIPANPQTFSLCGLMGGK